VCVLGGGDLRGERVLILDVEMMRFKNYKNYKTKLKTGFLIF